MNAGLMRAVVLVLTLLVGVGLGAMVFGGRTVEPHAAHDTLYTCSMHPQIRQDTPGTCPICGMDLVPVQQGQATAGRGDRVVLSERARALARLQTTEVRREGDAAAEVALRGRVVPDERTRKNVTTWVGGRIDRLHVNTTGEEVHAGQVVATLYSPEVYAAHQDLLTARGQVQRLAGGTSAALQAASVALEASRERLRLLGVPGWELERMESADKPTQAVALRTPFGGTVIERVATEGSYVQTGATLYRVADLSKLWVELDAYESDLPQLAVGQSVALEVEGTTGLQQGTVAFIDPTVDPQRRTATVRVELDNPEGQLRPGLFAEAVVSSSPGGSAPLVIPVSAPLFTGKRSVVYVEIDDGEVLAYAPRTVRLGPRLGEVYPVLAGLEEGERVVSRGAFALDADLQIRGGPSMMMAPDDRDAAAEVPLDAEELSRLAPVLQRYLAVQRALAEDDHAAASAAAAQLQQAVGSVALVGEAAAAWDGLEESLQGAAGQVAGSTDIKGARRAFEPLSAAVETVLTVFGNPLDAPLQLAFCPMAHDNAGASWIQQGDKVDNAYFGAAMRTCGEIEHELAPGERP